MYFDDIEIGRTEESAEIAVDRDEMVDYAMRNDPFPIHVDEQSADATIHGGLIASFGYVVSLFFRLIHTMEGNEIDDEAFLGALEWKVAFRKAVRPGDRLRVRAEVTSKRLTSKGDRGVVTARHDVLNQDGDPVVVIDVVSLVLVRPTTASDDRA